MIKTRICVTISQEMVEYSKENKWVNRSMLLELALRKLKRKYPHTIPIDKKRALDEAAEQ